MESFPVLSRAVRRAAIITLIIGALVMVPGTILVVRALLGLGDGGAGPLAVGGMLLTAGLVAIGIGIVTSTRNAMLDVLRNRPADISNYQLERRVNAGGGHLGTNVIIVLRSGAKHSIRVSPSEEDGAVAEVARAIGR